MAIDIERIARELREDAENKIAYRKLVAQRGGEVPSCHVDPDHLLAVLDDRDLQSKSCGAMQSVCAEICEIMATYREQEAKQGYVDTPGGLEHMGDVWRLLRRWDEEIRAAGP